jgi:hypothetical protein
MGNFTPNPIIQKKNKKFISNEENAKEFKTLKEGELVMEVMNKKVIIKKSAPN